MKIYEIMTYFCRDLYRFQESRGVQLTNYDKAKLAMLDAYIDMLDAQHYLEQCAPQQTAALQPILDAINGALCSMDRAALEVVKKALKTKPKRKAK